MLLSDLELFSLNDWFELCFSFGDKSSFNALSSKFLFLLRNFSSDLFIVLFFIMFIDFILLVSFIVFIFSFISFGAKGPFKIIFVLIFSNSLSFNGWHSEGALPSLFGPIKRFSIFFILFSSNNIFGPNPPKGIGGINVSFIFNLIFKIFWYYY